jgi:hypothetical protein
MEGPAPFASSPHLDQLAVGAFLDDHLFHLDDHPSPAPALLLSCRMPSHRPADDGEKSVV